jgi:hypothetical protein
MTWGDGGGGGKLERSKGGRVRNGELLEEVWGLEDD